MDNKRTLAKSSSDYHEKVMLSTFGAQQTFRQSP